MKSEDELVDEEAMYVPERDWWKRTYPVEVLPKPIASEFHAVRRRFGIDIANLVLFVYKTWGASIAKVLARRILMFENHEELFKFLVSKIDLFDERSRKILSSMLQVYRYAHYFDELISIASELEKRCPGVRDKSLKLYHQLVVKGYFYTPDCVALYSVYILGCRDVSIADPKCRKVFEHISKVVEGEKP